MARPEVVKQIRNLVKRIFVECVSKEDAIRLDKEIDELYKQTGASPEEKKVLVDSGAGEMLYMLKTIPEAK